jgi:hypothetical protein
MRASRWGGYRKISVICATAAALFVMVGTAQAASTAYPKGGGSFTGGPEGWETTEASCNIAVLCTASGGYDNAVGDPAGSLAATTNIALNVASVFKSTVTMVSPDFKVGEDGTTSLHLDRAFTQGNLVDLSPALEYEVNLIDRTAKTQSTPIKESVPAGPFAGVDHASSVIAGHTYAIEIKSTISSSVAGTGLLAGSTSVNYDNVSLSVQGAGNGNGNGKGKGGGAGGGGGGGLTNSELRSLLVSSLHGSAVLKGNKIRVRAKCPAKAGVACRITLRGMLKKKRAATSSRKSKVRKGKRKRFVLRVKPRARARVARSRRLLFKETVRAGRAKAVVYRRLKLVRL